jgi:hypothetical protein
VYTFIGAHVQTESGDLGYEREMNTWKNEHLLNTWSDYITQGFLEDDIGHPTDIASDDG